MALQELLNARNISKYRLSQISGVPKTTIIDICSGKSSLENCTAKTVYRIALALDCSVEYLLSLSSEDDNLCDSKSNISTECSNSRRNLKDFGIDFYVDKSLETSFFALIDGIKNDVSYLDCLRDELLGSVHASFNAGLLSTDQAEFIEQNFIFSNRGVQHG